MKLLFHAGGTGIDCGQLAFDTAYVLVQFLSANYQSAGINFHCL